MSENWKVDNPTPESENGEVDNPTPESEHGEVDNPTPKSENWEVDIPTPESENWEVDNPTPESENWEVDNTQPESENGEVDNATPESENCEVDNTTPEEPVATHSGWRFSYPVGVGRGRYKARPKINDLNETWLESARELELYEMSCDYAAPRVDRQPHTLLIKELITLLQCPEAVTRTKANLYLREWLVLHPAVTRETVQSYSDAFRLSQDNGGLIDTIKSCMENEEPFTAVWFVELCVSMFQINFNHCLKQGGVSVLQSCMISKWLWVSPDSVLHSGSTSQLLSLLEVVIISPQSNTPLCVALCSLISIAAECVRLASVQWNPEDPNFVADPALALGRDLAKRIQHCLSVHGFDTASLVICSVKPCWLRTLVIAVILSSYNDCLLSEKIHLNKISLSSIVSQYFFLVPSLHQDHRFTKKSFMTASSSKNSGEYFVPNTHSICEPKRNGKLKSILNASKVNKRNHLGKSAVHIACKRNNVEKLQQLLAVPGVDVNLKDNDGWTPLHEACNHGSYDCVLLLLYYVPHTATSSASEQGDPSARKVDLNVVAGEHNVTPLIDAVKNNHVEICRQLIKYGGKELLNAKTTDGWTALDLASSKEMREVLNGVTLSASILEPGLGGSQEPSFPQPVRIDTVSTHEDDPLSPLYEKVIGAKYVPKKDLNDFLSLLTYLVSSYYMTMSSHPSNHFLDYPHERDSYVLSNMKDHLKLLKRHVKRLTRDDFRALFFQMQLLEIVCLSKL